MAEKLTDPMRPPKYMTYNGADQVEHVTNEYKLSQIYISKKTQFAMINQQKVKTGDWLEGAQVVVIKSDRVHLLIDGIIKEITIMPSIKHY